MHGGYLRFPKKEKAKFVLLGSGKLLCDSARLLIQKGFPKPLIITHPRRDHLRDQELLSSPRYKMIYESVFEFAKSEKLELYEFGDINSEAVFKLLKKMKITIACSFGLRCLVKKEFIASLDGLVLNCHGTDLPKYRGGALGSWQILNREKRVYGLFHLIDEKFDSGNIVIKKSLLLKKQDVYPVDWLARTWQVNLQVFDELLKVILKEGSIKTVSQDIEKGSYFPRLKTEIHGAIDWNWSSSEIERFVRAFGWPYSGAFTFIGEEKVALARVKITRQKFSFHSFLTGLVFRRYSDGSIEVVTRDGALKIISIRRKDREVPAATVIRVGDRLCTPSNILDHARTHRAKY